MAVIAMNSDAAIRSRRRHVRTNGVTANGDGGETVPSEWTAGFTNA